MGGWRRIAIVGSTLVATLALAATASARTAEAPARGAPPAGDAEPPPPPTKPEPRISIELKGKGMEGGRLTVGRRVHAVGTMRPFRPNQRVSVTMKRGGKTAKRKVLRVRRRGRVGRFKLRQRLVKPGLYRFRAVHPESGQLAYGAGRSGGFRIRYPSLRQGDRGKPVRLLNKLLRRQGYVTGSGERFGKATARAAIAFRKVNGESRSPRISSQDFERLAKGKGGYKVEHPKAGKHVEVSISKQVMALVRGKRVAEVYHVSTGKPGTPSVRGKFRFYMRQPGYNNVRMKDSVYFHRGYAIHGYNDVPDYPASHGCVRSPIPNATHIYNWVEIGMQIFIY